ncbi:MAG: carbohydrate ABC transporter permease [Eubacterium sp.]|nr:carbohydrate ABC transporter permease [Eubacterium sp.]
MKTRKFKISNIFIYTILSVWALTTIFPLVWSIMNSFKDKKQIYRDSFSLPLGNLFSLKNYEMLFERYDIARAYMHSIIISGTVTIAVILFAGMAAYIMSRYKFKGKGILEAVLYAGMMFPVFSTIVPNMSMLTEIGIAGQNDTALNMLAVILLQIAGNMCFAIIVLTSYIRTLPIELEEAAYMEGCNIFQIYFKVIMPLSKPSFVTVGVFSFLWSYNDLFTQMFFLRTPDDYAITVLLNNIASKEGVNYGALFSSVTLIVIPVLVVYLLLQKYIIKGMTVGAVKG